MTASDRVALWLPTAADDDEYIGPYRVVRKVGEGGMGVVHLGVDPVDRPVAIKVLREHIAGDATARARLRRELATLERVRHRCVAGVLDADTEAQAPYIVTEFVSGPQLDEYVDEHGPLSRDALATLGNGLIGALAAIHETGVVHRDLKPGNVLLRDGQPVVIDFGIAQLADDVRLTMTGLFVGTPGYVAPEVIYGRTASPATDWWGWAATMVFAATGRSPAGTGPVEVVLDRIRRGDLDLSRVDDDLRPLLEDCLSTEAADRPDAARIERRFARYAAGRSTASTAKRSNAAVLAPVPNPSAGSEQGATSSADQPPAADTPPKTAVLPRSKFALPWSKPAPDSEPDPPKEADPPPKKAGKLARSRAPFVAPSTRGVRRGGTLAAMGLLFVALAASMPLVGVGALWLGLTVARFVDRFTQGLQWRDESSGPRRSNVIKELVVSPWSAGSALVVSAATLLLPVALGTGIALVAGELAGAVQLGMVSIEPNLALGFGACAALPVLWWGPGGDSTRRATRRAVQVLSPGRYGATILTASAIAGVLFLGVLVWQFPTVNWWPSLTPPGPFS